MSNCRCGYADECDGQHATFYPLQDGGMCAVVPCNAPIVETEEEILERQRQRKNDDLWRLDEVSASEKANTVEIRAANTPPRPKIRGNELTLHLALHILRNPWPFDQRERDAVRLWAADELERLSVQHMQSALQPNV